MNLNQITVPSLDVERAMEFYKKLGLKLIVKALPRYIRFELPKGDATFSVHLVATLPQGSGVVVYFETEQLDAEVTRLQQLGIVFEQEPIMQTWLWREARLCDPDGNQLILYHAGDDRKNPPWRITSDSI